jgi:Fe-Mn family superoxide dismutase
MNRRELVFSAGLVPLVLGAARDGGAEPGVTRALKPLPFDPAKLKGLSEKLLRSHHENNYGGAVRNLAKVEDELSRLPATALPATLGALREKALLFHNSMTLHEAYFGNLGGDGKIAGAFAKQLPFDVVETMRAAATSLAGGSGWVTLAMHTITREVVLTVSRDHTQAHAGAVPLLVLDMYEHSYALDYGAAAAKYLDAFFANLKWEEVERRFEAVR